MNVVSGVPTNFVFQAASTSSFAVSDLVAIADQIAGTASLIPTEQLPNLEIRPVSDTQPIEFKFAVFDDPITGIGSGLVLSGALYAALSQDADV